VTDEQELLKDLEAPRIEALFKFAHGHRVRYEEIDAQGIVGSASWISLLQLGRVEYLRYLGLLLEGGSRAPVQAVVRRTVVDHLAPARFDDPLAIRVRAAQLGQRSARLEYIIDNIETGLRPVVAETLIVCVELATFRSSPWPEFWRDRVREFEGENLILGQR
jgi:acyl-CoA thioester hydrolase